jgi:hypothetical protein
MFKCFKHGNDIILDSKPDDVTETHVSVTPGIYIKAFPFLIQITNISREKKTEKKGEEQAFCPGLQKEEEATDTKS